MLLVSFLFLSNTIFLAFANSGTSYSTQIIFENINGVTSESEFLEQSTDNNLYVLLELDREGYTLDTPVNYETVSQAQSALSDYREDLSSYHTPKNYAFLVNTSLEKRLNENAIVISNYSPHILIEYETLYDLECDLPTYNEVIENASIDTIYVSNYESKLVSDVVSDEYPLLYDFEDALSDIHTSSQYNGQDINVGI